MGASPFIRPVVLSGGSGTRLWPLSRRHAPKQFQALTSERSLFRQTLDRTSDRGRFEAPLIVCNRAHADVAEKEMAAAGISDAKFVLEPSARNTAPAIVVACLLEAEEDPHRPLLFLPSDHWTARPGALTEAAINAVPLATAGKLVLFGIRPDRIETGYGYIRMGQPIRNSEAHDVASFVEKPHREVALTMIAQGQHVWNSGIFLFTAATLLAEAERLQPAVYSACRTALAKAVRNGKYVSPDADAFAEARNLSIDHGIMERTSSAVVVPVDPGWSDVGSWPALYDLLPKDAEGNVINGRTITRGTRRCLVHGSQRLIATLGIEDLVIVDTEDALLVAHRNSGQEVGKIVDRLRQEGANEVERPPSAPADDLAYRTLVIPSGQDVEIAPEAEVARHIVVLRGCIEIDRGRKAGRAGDSLPIPQEGERVRNPGPHPARCKLLSIPLSESEESGP